MLFSSACSGGGFYHKGFWGGGVFVLFSFWYIFSFFCYFTIKIVYGKRLVVVKNYYFLLFYDFLGFCCCSAVFACLFGRFAVFHVLSCFRQFFTFSSGDTLSVYVNFVRLIYSGTLKYLTHKCREIQ